MIAAARRTLVAVLFPLLALVALLAAASSPAAFAGASRAGSPSAGAASGSSAPSQSAGQSTAPQPAAKTRKSQHSLLVSRELWATVDICDPADEPNTIGVRGSMPGDGSARDTLYMRFQLQYLQPNGNWSALAHDGDSGFISLGSGTIPRQGGTSFQLKPGPGKPSYKLRGLVTFQWRRGNAVVHQATRTTSAGHHSLTGANPPNYSAAQCVIG